MTALVRPNGKTYRPRREPRVDVYYDHDDVAGVVVIGTHDLEAATELATPLWEHPEPLPSGTPSWWRLVPWDTGTGYDRNWIVDQERGSPVVIFHPDDVVERDLAAIAAETFYTGHGWGWAEDELDPADRAACIDEMVPVVRAVRAALDGVGES